MMPVGPLMIEHRLIERMVALLKKQARHIDQTQKADVPFLEAGIDFFRIYADKNHHGKEEDILFKGLAKKDLSQEHARIMNELLQEHVLGRKLVGKLEAAKADCGQGKKEALAAVSAALKELTVLYPKHIEKEDKHFFLPVMAYFTKKEQDAMIVAFREFDKKTVLKDYEKLVERLERA